MWQLQCYMKQKETDEKQHHKIQEVLNQKDHLHLLSRQKPALISHTPAFVK